MRRTVGAVAILALAVLAGCSDEGGTASAEALPVGSGFDFYVLALSWSPSYCAAEGADANRQQCGGGRPHAFVVHGLWPQFERGYPEHCASDEVQVDAERLRSLYPIMPSAGLIRHQWRKHGTCSGLSQSDYFAVLGTARSAVRIPPAYRALAAPAAVDPIRLEDDFRSANPGLPADGIAVTCDNRYVREVRICMTRTLSFRSCPEVDRRACRRPRALMPAVRGG